MAQPNNTFPSRPFCGDKIPQGLKDQKRWAPWKAVWSEKRGKYDKVPCYPNGAGISTAKPEKWLTYEAAVAGYEKGKGAFAGVGYVITGVHGLVGVDLDHCIEGGVIKEWAKVIVDELATYTEVSPSGIGLRMFVHGEIDVDWTNSGVGIEVYAGHAPRFLTVTGARLKTSVEEVVGGERVAQALGALGARYGADRRAKADVISMTMPELLDELALPDLGGLGLSDGVLEFLAEGTVGVGGGEGATGDRSGALHGAGVALYAAGLSDEQVFSLLVSSEWAMEVALDHRRQDGDRALMYLWVEHCQKAKAKAAARVASVDDFDDVSGWADPVREAGRETLSAVMKSLAEMIESVTEVGDLERVVAARVRREKALGDVERSQVAGWLQSRAKVLGAPLAVALVRAWLKPRVGSAFKHLGEDDHPLCTIENLEILLGRLRVTVRYNVISKRVEILVPGKVCTMDNEDNVALAHIMSECEKARMPTKHVLAFLLNIADNNLYNPVVTWAESRPWDGVSRLQALFDTVHSRAALRDVLLRKWLVQAMAAAAIGGGQYRGVLTFTGAQYKGKTTWLTNLAPKGLVLAGHTLDTHSKDSQLIALGYWIVELGELDGTFKKSDISALKSFVSNTRDTIRRPYAVSESRYARRTVWGASVNDAQFLADTTGNSRFWTIPADSFEWDHKIDMQQLWAEVLELVKGGESWDLNAVELAKLSEHNEEFEVPDVMYERISAHFDWSKLGSGHEWATSSRVAMMLGIKDPTNLQARSAGATLRKLNGGMCRKSNGTLLFAIPQEIAEF